MRRWQKLILICMGVLVIGYIIISRIPIKNTVKIEEINQFQNCILVQETWHTGTGWEQVGDESGFLQSNQYKDVHLIGDIPFQKFYAELNRDVNNTFVCSVKYTGNYTIPNTSETYEQYEVLEWYPLYPVKRNTILPDFFYPNDYLSLSDLRKW